MFSFANEEMFTLALQLQEPWYVERTEFTGEELHIYVSFKKGYKFKINDEESTTAYDTLNKTWRHLNFFQYKAFIHCNVPRIKTKNGINMIDVPWSRLGSGFTLLFESFVIILIKSMPVKAVANIVAEHDTRIWRILKYYVNKAREEANYSNVEKVG
ncbi:MAG: ISL3 family transposase, partial [Oscillospiraceae bacterium]|nr:ISL3 family transposase [Oscillospiraceae bacterium]